MGLSEYSHSVRSTGVISNIQNGRAPVLRMQLNKDLRIKYGRALILKMQGIKQGPNMNLH